MRCSAECLKSLLLLAVFNVVNHQQRSVEKNLLRFAIRDPVFLIFPGVAFIPVKACNLRKIGHVCIL